MYLKSLVLKGFKSFAERSALSLEPGITAIVGPNGSGKSNISDAVLWVLGERNAKHLRGQAMEDVIFSGSSARKATGLAEVDLVLDNSDGTLPVDFNEVSITRRMYRNGESEYLINGSTVRRLDVLDILHDSGLGTGTHSIISQGSLDSILQSRPEDRRALIEEAAGVLKHKQRKAKSQRKLDLMDQHMLRVHDVVAEVERQLGPLERKAKRARTFEELSADLSDLRLRLAVDDLRNLQASWESVKQREAALNADLDLQRDAISQSESALEAIQERIRQESTDAGVLERRYRSISAIVERIDSALLVMRERRRSAENRASELRLTLESGGARRTSLLEELEQTRAKQGDVYDQKNRISAELADHQQRQAALEAQRKETQSSIASLNRRIHETEQQLARTRKALASAREALANGLAHRQVIESHKAELTLQLQRAQSDANDQAEAVESAQKSVIQEEAAEKAAKSAAEQAMADRDEARRTSERARDTEHGLEADIKALEEIERAATQSAGPARQWLDEHQGQLPGALQSLSRAVGTRDPKLEPLVEHLLGPDVTAVLIDDAPSVRRIAELLADQQAEGEVTLLLRQGASDLAAPVEHYPSTGLGTPLLPHLSYSSDAARAISAFLGDVVICPTLADALVAHGQDKLGLRFVSEDGAIVWPSGKVTFGKAVIDGPEGALTRTRRLASLRGQLNVAKEETAQALERLEKAEQHVQVTQAESFRLRQSAATLRGRLEAAKNRADQIREQIASLRREQESVQSSLEAADAQVEESRPQLDVHESRIAELTATIDQLRTERIQQQEAQEPLDLQISRLGDQIGQKRLEIATLKERGDYLDQTILTRTGQLKDLDRQSEQARLTCAQKEASVQRIGPLIELFDRLADTARAWTEEIERQSDQAQSSTTNLHQAASEARERTRVAREAHDRASDELSQVRVEKGRLELQVETAVDAIVKDLQVPLDHALDLPPMDDRPEAEEQAEKIQRRIKNLGTINPDAAEEYRVLKERYDYLAGQLDDLDSARKALAKINRVIDARMKDDFVDTFDRVNENFQEIFAVLFPGGAAHLSLDDPDDLDNTGVEVSAQPRGKRISKMSLMSGGEKSLTALALLFAVYRTRSTPFYILDEVEAALDDTNLRRLMEYIDHLRDSTQLIMITHQRRTMEMADVLFGVSMQADGVTKVISQKLDKALKYAEE